jgi:DNA-binding YbaB/EbfC family protein
LKRGFGGVPGGGNMGGMNMNQLMKQAQKMQQQMEKMQDELVDKTYEVTSGGGAVKIVIGGNKEIKELEIQKDVVDADDVEMLQDLIMTAVNEAIRHADEAYQAEMGRITGAPGMPGLF